MVRAAMTTAMQARLLAELAGAGVVRGRHVVVTAHADDEVITFGGALGRLADAVIVQLTSGVSGRGPTYPDHVAQRRAERRAAAMAGGWLWPTIDGPDIAAREAHRHLSTLIAIVRAALIGSDVAWTHPYEQGHIDHDTAAWIVQHLCEAPGSPLRMEFASYHATEDHDIFGVFAPCPSVPTVTVRYTEAALDRKRAAVSAYASQAHIVRKFPALDVESYRVAPVYDFLRPALKVSRWDRKGYTPSTTEWRMAIATFAQEAA